MRLLQVNVWMGRVTPALVRFIERENPDIICAQEVFSSDGRVVFPDRQFNCLELIREASGLENVYFSPVISMDVAGGVAEFGNVVLSRYPMTEKETFFVNGEFIEHHSRENHVENTRNMQVVKLDVDGRELVIVNHQGYWRKTPMGDEVSAEKMKIVASKAREYDDLPLMVVGDMNVTHESDAMRVFDGWLDDPVTRSGARSTLSGLGYDGDVVCDHILVNEKVRVDELEVKQDIVSDHLALVMEFGL